MRGFMAGLVVVASTVAVTACSSTATNPQVPTGSVTFTSPAGGESYQVGDTVELAWSCADCTNVPTGDYLEVLAYDGVSTYLLDPGGQMTDSTSWVVGSSAQNVQLLPGTYQMVAQDADGYYAAQSRFFQIVATP